MPPKAKPTTSTQIFIVIGDDGIDSVYANHDSATARVNNAKNDGIELKLETETLIGGTINAVEEKPAVKAKAAPKAAKVEKEDALAPAKKTKAPSEQRAANSKKPGKPSDEDIPENVKALLAGSGNVFQGQTVVVTGVPPTIGRKNAEKLVEAYGGHLGKSLSKKTAYVVVGNDAGPKKLDQIDDLGLKTMDGLELIAMIEEGISSGGAKRSASDEDEEGEEEEEEKKPKPKTKKQKK